jgi:hypothetical protein
MANTISLILKDSLTIGFPRPLPRSWGGGRLPHHHALRSCHNALGSSGTSSNFRVTLASLKSPLVWPISNESFVSELELVIFI